MIVKSYAKINLVLNVLGKYNEKLHEVDMIMIPLELHDSLMISRLKGNKETFVTFEDFSIGGVDNNLATKAVNALEEETGMKDGFRILINKCIPISAGLGGGSSNCAATLKGVNEMAKLNLSDEQLSKIGFALGSDVPFFIKNVPARVRGAGEIVEPIDVKNNYYVLIVKPKEGLSTTEVYKACDSFKLKTYNIDKVVQALKDGDDDTLAREIGNALEDVSISMLPKIKEIKEEMKQLGLKIVLMSGSGSSVFGMSTDKKLIKDAFKYFIEKPEDQDFEVEMCKVIKGV